MMVDALGRLFEADDVIELRVIPRRGKKIKSGYFDFDNRKELAQAAKLANKAGANVYVTINKINPGLLGRCTNRVDDADKTTSDVDVVRRRWMLVDLDPVRPSGTAATNAHVKAAKAMARNMVDMLTGLGWAKPLTALSGNGCHLYFPLDMPNDEESRDAIKATLAELARRFDDPVVHVDQSVFNAARISKLPGTMSTKGDHSDKTPWRLAKLVTTPKRDAVVTLDMMRALLPDTAPKPAQPVTTATEFATDVPAMLGQLGIDYTTTIEDGTVKFKLTTCPFDPAHTDKSAIIIQPGGALGFHCFAGSCTDKHWRDFKALLAAPGGSRAQGLNIEIPDGKESQSSKLVRFVLEKNTLIHDLNKDVYAISKDTNETRRVDGRGFRDWLLAYFYAAEEASPRDQAVREALSTLAGVGRHEGECHPVHVRVAAHAGAYYIDMGESGNSRAIKITPGAWSITTTAPVLFARPEGLLPLHEPVEGGNLDLLWRIANIPAAARLLVLAWMCECFRPDTPHPVLELFGEQGTAKSTSQSALRDLIDPHVCNLRAAPKSGEDIFVGAGVNWLISYENMSHIPGPMQDALCTLATGGGFAKRKLYSDADESIIVAHRPVVLNGISLVVTQQDLIDRAITIELPAIAAFEDSAGLRVEFNKHRGNILGGLLDLFVRALAHIPAIDLPPKERPRLVEFARLGMALAVAQGGKGEDFMSVFNEARAEAVVRTIDASPVAGVLMAWFDSTHRENVIITPGDLMKRVESWKLPGTDNWPKSAKGFADALRRAAPALRHVGIEVGPLKQKKSHGMIPWQVVDIEMPK